MPLILEKTSERGMGGRGGERKKDLFECRKVKLADSLQTDLRGRKKRLGLIATQETSVRVDTTAKRGEKNDLTQIHGNVLLRRIRFGIAINAHLALGGQLAILYSVSRSSADLLTSRKPQRAKHVKELPRVFTYDEKKLNQLQRLASRGEK
eukprot:767831-Hanusia_phi.AAC.1